MGIESAIVSENLLYKHKEFANKSVTEIVVGDFHVLALASNRKDV